MSKAPIHPNTVTTLRLPLAPIAVAFLITGTAWGTTVAAVLAVMLEITDVADGWIARRYNVVSDFGKLYDPFSDAFCRFTLFLGLMAIGVADLWMILIIFYRDSSIAFLRTVAATRNVVLAARWSGKVKAVVQAAGTQLVFIWLVLTNLEVVSTTPNVGWWTMLVITAVTAWSWLDYFIGNYRIVRSGWLGTLDLE